MAEALLAERAPAPVGPARRPVDQRVLATLPWLVVLAALPAAWWWTGVPAADVIKFAAYWGLALVLPGTLVHRALRGGRGNLAEDLGYGAATGLLLELAAWALAAATGGQQLLRWWPVPVVAAFVAVPRLRRHWRVGPRRPLPVAWHWSTCAVLLLLLIWGVAQWRLVPLPPVNHGYYQDLLYHLGLVQELTRSMPFELPHVAGESLRYHYLSDAHIAAGSMITGLPPATVLLRLWLVPVVATAALVTAGLARDLAGVWWSGPVVAALGYVGLPVVLGSTVADGTIPLSYASPSQTYVLPLVVLLAGLCVEVVRGRGLGPGWVLVPAIGLACAGAKSSALPPLIAGLVLAGLVAWWTRRRVPWPALAALLCLLAAMGVGYRLFAGGGAGTLRVQLFGLLRFWLAYGETVGSDDGVKAGGVLTPGLAHADVTGWVVVLSLLAWWLLMQAPRLVGFLLPASREHRADPAGWLLAGAVTAGAGATWVFHHPSASQIYFWLAVIPFGAVLTGWFFAAIRPAWPAALTAAAAGAVAQLVAPAIGRPAPTPAGWLGVLAGSAARLAAFVILAAALAVGVTALLGRRAADRDGIAHPDGAPRPDLPDGALVAGAGEPADAGETSGEKGGDRPGDPDGGHRPGVRRTGSGRLGGRRWSTVALAGVTAALLGASVVPGVEGIVRSVNQEAAPADPAGQRFVVTAAEMRGALWLDAHAADDDVVATNVHCRPVRTTPHCDARAYWVTGLGGHRAVVESWAYTDAALAAHGKDGLGYPRQGPPDAELFALNERVFTAPTAADLDRLRREFGVRWLFADARAGAVSPELARLAPVRHVSGPVTVYELPRS
ncbi:hypothetical protein [Micromonospora sp. WMMD812]|uniref:hypothetical protein n=1 Tax=Micromonospora sp. WMMD812 TaxID=3015152 RepID=UPI00248B849A|nr:hypothetical protein [Micromonospora sp. WMMD812]WBB65600.1 hypothetical protein O7603_20650 [Micromonospora sp. WMMD812]